MTKCRLYTTQDYPNFRAKLRAPAETDLDICRVSSSSSPTAVAHEPKEPGNTSSTISHQSYLAVFLCRLEDGAVCGMVDGALIDPRVPVAHDLKARTPFSDDAIKTG